MHRHPQHPRACARHRAAPGCHVAMRPRPDLSRANLLASAQYGLVTTVQCREIGLTADQLTDAVRHGAWRRLARGVYDTQQLRPTSPTYEWWRRRAIMMAQLAGGPDAIAVGMSALAVWGVWGVPKDLKPQIAYPGARGVKGARSGIVRRFDIAAEVDVVGGVPCVDIQTALVQAIPETSRYVGLGLIDSALNKKLLDEDGLLAVRERSRRRRGVARWHDWWNEVDGRAESPAETWARLDCVDHHLPPDELQVVLVDGEDEFVARGDLGWRRRGGGWVIAEIDGLEEHAAPSALYRDRTRQNAVVHLPGVDMLRYTSADRGGVIARDVRSLLAA